MRLSPLLLIPLTLACAPATKDVGDSGAPQEADADSDADADTDTDTAPPGGLDTDTAPPGGLDTDAEVDPEAASQAVFDAIIDVTELASGDLSCFRPGTSCASLEADKSCITEQTLSGTVLDFESGGAVPGATVEIFGADYVSDEPDAVLVSGEDGGVSGATVLACTGVTYRVSEGTGAPATIGLHQAYSDRDGSLDAATFLSLSTETVATFPELLGLTPDPEKGMVTGRMSDCAGGPLQSVQVIASQGGYYLEEQSVHYFSGPLPDLAQQATNDDGRWLIAELPPGSIWIEVYGVVEGIDDPLLMAYTDVSVLAGSASIVELQLGLCGTLLPDACLDPCL